ncbi:aldehyde oxidoreductase molybdenum-binding subunit PaoC [Stakelama tenebrarum]|uniref:Xanthine dehydrogenase family protein molybdopterin-binding subunit n=1 Tax=Stakelama tenebrarum TaxID=2711215 RepID=A0A6G6Y929_9SPHN|nr:aldehyde oxidoreductase molybdenum-binding subunit PaoC [Sphingosinithalassobacter tenebrarum]QIG81083.1 xanthine dehydrogenase family protein molybdopterin-binding subunit [Sphingosinithalassobacter tenebrarum]
MEFNAPAGNNLFDNAKVVGKSTPRIDGPLKTTGTAPYAYERHDVAPNQAYGWIVGSAIAKGRIASMDVTAARNAPGVIAVVAAPETDPVGKGMANYAPLFGGSEIAHYHQAIACVVAETFEQARAAANLIQTRYERAEGQYDLAAAKADAPLASDSGPQTLGDFESAFAAAPVTVDATYHTPDESHAMMEPFATIAAWDGDRLTLWTSNQMIQWGKQSLGKILGISPDKIRVDSPFLGGGFGGKLFVRADAVLAALAAKASGRPVKIAMQRPLVFNNTTHRHATIQRVRLGAGQDGRITAIAHENWSGNLPGGGGEDGTLQTPKLYAGANRLNANYLARLDLPEGNAMRAPGEAAGHLALEVAMDELAEKLDMCPVRLRLLNDSKDVVPGDPETRISDRHLDRCLREGAQKFGWAHGGKFPRPASRREGRWLMGMGMSAGYRSGPALQSAARIRLGADGRITVETDMTDIGTGSYTIIAQTAAEVMGVPLSHVQVELGDSRYPVSAGSGGQWGAASSTAGVYAACVNLRRAIGEKLGFDGDAATFENGRIGLGNRSIALADAGPISAEDSMTYGDFKQDYDVGTYAAHFCEVAVDAYTGETHVRRMLSVCDAGRILNPLSARSQVIGAMVMSVGAALTEELAVDKRFGFFVNHDLAGYEVPVHADIPHQEVVFLDTLDPIISPMKAKGVGELGICGPGAAVANAVYNATGVRTRAYPLTLDKYLDQLPAVDG